MSKWYICGKQGRWTNKFPKKIKGRYEKNIIVFITYWFNSHYDPKVVYSINYFKFWLFYETIIPCTFQLIFWFRYWLITYKYANFVFWWYFLWNYLTPQTIIHYTYLAYSYAQISFYSNHFLLLLNSLVKW